MEATCSSVRMQSFWSSVASTHTSVSSHSDGHESSEKQLKRRQGVWYECPEVKRFALPAGRAHLIRVTDCVRAVFAIGIHSLNAMKRVKHIDAQNVG